MEEPDNSQRVQKLLGALVGCALLIVMGFGCLAVGTIGGLTVLGEALDAKFKNVAEGVEASP